MLDTVQALAGEIGPRGTGTAGEAAAAETVAARLADLGLPVERQAFRAIPSQNTYPLAFDLLLLAAVALYPLGGSFTRWTAALLALAVPALLWQVIRTSWSVLHRFLPTVPSQSVIARVAPVGPAEQRLVILAHLDTNRCRLVWQSGAVRSLAPLTRLTLGVLCLPGLLYLAGALAGGLAWAWPISLLPAAYAFGTIVTLVRDDRAPFSPGANDNAASVAVALEAAAQLAGRPLKRTEVWLAFTGAEETDHAGLYALLRRGGPEMRRALFLGLEGAGGGERLYLTRQGLLDLYRPDPGLLRLAEQTAAAHPELGFGPGEMLGMEDETGTLRRLGYRAICLAGRDPVTGTLPRWHRPDDLPETLTEAGLERAAQFVLAFVETVDREIV